MSCHKQNLIYLLHRIWSNKFVHNEKGFTLLELLIVVIILGILSAIAVPNLLAQIDKARYVQAISDMKCVSNDLRNYHLERGVFPRDVSRNVKPSGIECFPLNPQNPTPFDSQYDYDSVNAGAGRCYIQISFFGKNKLPERPANTVLVPQGGIYYYRELASGVESDDLIFSLGIFDVPCQ